MKNLFGIFAAALLILGFTVRADAYFGAGDLVRVMYDTNTSMEVATDLGSIAQMQSPGFLLQAAPVSLSLFGAETSWNNVKTAYFGLSADSMSPYIASAGAPTPAAANEGSGLIGNINSLLGLYSLASTLFSGGGSTVSLSYSGLPNSYYNLMDGSGVATGSMGGYLNSASALQTEVNNGVGSSLYLYAFANSNTTNPGASAQVLIKTSGGITELDGLNPIPPSILLMGLGLILLIGIFKRKPEFFFGDCKQL